MKRKFLFVVAIILFTNLTTIVHSDNLILNATVNLPSAEKIAFYSGRSGNNEIYLMNTDGSNQQNLTNHPASDMCPAISPGGEKIAFLSDRNGNWDIFVMNTDGTNVTRLTSTTANEDHPSWSHDGSKIFFIRDYSSSTEIWVMNSNGSNHQRLTSNSTRDERPFLSPDGSKIVFMSNRDGNYEIYTMNADGSDQNRITNTSYWEIFPVWSPDGLKIAYAKNFSSGGVRLGGIHIINPDGSGDQQLTDPSQKDENPCWSPDGNYIIFQSVRDGNFEIYKMDANGSNQTRLTNNSAWDGWPSWGIHKTQTGIIENGSDPWLGYHLYQHYLNPFNPTTSILYKIPKRSLVSLNVFDILGNEVGTLVYEEKPAGTYEIEFSATGHFSESADGGRNLSSRVYLYQLRTQEFVDIKKMILLK